MIEDGNESASDQSRTEPAPTTGLPAVDEALARLSELGSQPVSEHPDQLSSAHEALHDALQSQPGSTDG